jgi:hypothetical protein
VRQTTLTWAQVAKLAVKALTAAERQRGAAYLDEVVRPAGTSVEIDRKAVPVRRPLAVVFVDQAPGVNWGHPCRYLLIDLQDGRIQSVPAQFPPFLRAVPKTLRLIWKGDTVPEWAIARP